MSSDSAKNRFVIEESSTEMAWLQLFGPLATTGMGGLFSERSDLSGVRDILDIGCGPGEWVNDVAREYPDVHVTGIDVSQAMLDYAAAHAKARGLDNAHFLVMDATQPLDFADASFDLVNARTIVGFMNPELWPELLQECRRILRPGGTFRITEFSEGLTNSAAAGTLWGFYSKALTATGRSFDPDGRHIGIINQLPSLLREAAYQNVQMKAHAIEHSAGTPEFEGWYQNYAVVFRLLKPFLLKVGIVPEAEFDALYQQVIGEMLSDKFTALEIYLTVWGQK